MTHDSLHDQEFTGAALENELYLGKPCLLLGISFFYSAAGLAHFTIK